MTNRDYRLNVRLTVEDYKRLNALCTVTRKSQSVVIREFIQNGSVNTTPDQQIILGKQAQDWDLFNKACLTTQKRLDTISHEVHGLRLASHDSNCGMQDRIESLCTRLDNVLNNIQEDFKIQCNCTEKEMSKDVRF